MATEFSFSVNRDLTETETKTIKEIIGASMLRAITFYEDGVIRCESVGNSVQGTVYRQRQVLASNLTYSIGAGGENIKDKVW